MVHFRNEDSLCSRCWSSVLVATRDWRRALFYLPLSCILAWRPNRLWLSYVAGKSSFNSTSVSSWQIYVFAAGLLAVLSLLHIASSALGRDPCQSSAGADSVGESLLNSRQENYDRFEEVLVSVHRVEKSRKKSENWFWFQFFGFFFMKYWFITCY